MLYKKGSLNILIFFDLKNAFQAMSQLRKGMRIVAVKPVNFKNRGLLCDIKYLISK